MEEYRPLDQIRATNIRSRREREEATGWNSSRHGDRPLPVMELHRNSDSRHGLQREGHELRERESHGELTSAILGSVERMEAACGLVGRWWMAALGCGAATAS